VTADRLVATACLIISGLLLYAGTGHDFANAYVFPNLMAVVMIIISVVMLITAGSVRISGEAPVLSVPWAKLWPAFAVFVIYMMIAPRLGFFLSSFIAFTALGIIYSRQERLAPAIRNCVPIGLAFLAALYGLFVMLLQVQLPRGFLF
jgi:energy-converting hydrogenase Eha subunit G